MKMSRFHPAKSLLLLSAALLFAAAPARATLLFAGVDLGAAGRTTQWAMFALSGGITISDTSSQLVTQTVTSTDPGGATIGAAGGGSITLSGTAKVVGTGYIRSGGVLRKSGAATITGGIQPQNPVNDALTNQVVTDATAATGQANGLANTETNISRTVIGSWDSLTTVNQNHSLSLTDTAGASNCVLHLSDFILSGGATFTLTGSADTTYVINVSGTFSLLGGKIVLTGGLQPENVLFNITGSGTDVTLSSAAYFRGFLLAPDRKVNLSAASTLEGTLIAGKINVSGASRIKKPTYISP